MIGSILHNVSNLTNGHETPADLSPSGAPKASDVKQEPYRPPHSRDDLLTTPDRCR